MAVSSAKATLNLKPANSKPANDMYHLNQLKPYIPNPQTKHVAILKLNPKKQITQSPACVPGNF